LRRRDRIERKRALFRQVETEAPQQHTGPEPKSIYYKHYKALMIIPFTLLIIAILLISAKVVATGDFINKGIGLKGGISVTVPGELLDPDAIGAQLSDAFPSNEVNIRTIESTGVREGIIVETDILPDEPDATPFIDKVKEITGVPDEDVSVETIGSSLGDAFFKQTMIAMILAFAFMAIVVFLYFKTPAPSAAVVLAAASNIIITIATLDVLGIKIGTAGIAALLMLIGYSVDTDILLTTRVLKTNEGTVYERIIGAIKTGLIMNITTLVAVLSALFISESDVLKEIVTVVLIGLFADMINTWIQNAGILRWYMESRDKKEEAESSGEA